MSPYMLLVKIKDDYKKKISKDYINLNYWDKLYTQGQHLQSITHVELHDARIQTVSRD